MLNVKIEIDKLYNELLSNDIDYAKLQITIMGEAEGSSIYDKVLVAVTLLNRYYDKDKYKFGDIEEDYDGYSRPLKVRNVLERKQFSDSIRAIFIAEKLREIDPSIKDIYFFRTGDTMSLKYYYVEPVEFEGIQKIKKSELTEEQIQQLNGVYIEHTYFRITGPK